MARAWIMRMASYGRPSSAEGAGDCRSLNRISRSGYKPSTSTVPVIIQKEPSSKEMMITMGVTNPNRWKAHGSGLTDLAEVVHTRSSLIEATPTQREKYLS
jgi:hypothetical protein